MRHPRVDGQGPRPMSFTEIARELGVSRPRAQQIFRSALRKLKRSRALYALIGAGANIDSPGPAVFNVAGETDNGNRWRRARMVK